MGASGKLSQLKLQPAEEEIAIKRLFILIFYTRYVNSTTRI